MKSPSMKTVRKTITINWIIVLIDDTVHGDGYIMSIVIVCKYGSGSLSDCWVHKSVFAKSCDEVLTLTKKPANW